MLFCRGIQRRSLLVQSINESFETGSKRNHTADGPRALRVHIAITGKTSG